MTYITNISGNILTDGFVLSAGFTLNDDASNPVVVFSENGELDFYQNKLIRADSPTNGVKNILGLNAVDSAVNYLQIDSSVTGSSVLVKSVGTDTNIDLTLEGKGIGSVKTTGELVVGSVLHLPVTGAIWSTTASSGDKISAALLANDDAVNYVKLTSEATGVGATLATAGSDTDINLTIAPKGAGAIVTTAPIMLEEAGGNGLNSKEIAYVQTSDATVTDIYTLDLAEGEIVSIEVDVVANVDSTGANRAQYKLTGLFYRNTSGNVTQQGSTTSISTIESDSDWDCDLVADTGNQTVDVRVTGKAATTVNWLATIKFTILA